MAPTRQAYRENVSYSQAHLRLKKDRGRPDGFACSQCGDRAREWAYMGGDPEELSEHGRRYSLDQSRYSPLCVSCHRRHDRALADGRSTDVCPRGHVWTPENTGVRIKRSRSVGLRFCKACHRENSREYRSRRSAAAQTRRA